MSTSELDRLAERFWSGETTEAEEHQLKEAVLYGEHADRYDELGDYFRGMDEFKDHSLDEVFDKQIMLEVQLRENSAGSFPWLKMAAGIALLIGSFFLIKTLADADSPQPVEEVAIIDTYDDPEVAYREVKKALLMVGNGMNKGLSYTGSISEFDKAKDKIEKEDTSVNSNENE